MYGCSCPEAQQAFLQQLQRTWRAPRISSLQQVCLPPDLFKHRLMKDQAADRLRHECTCSARHWATMRSFTGATRESPQCGFLVSTEVSDYLALTNL